ncbi:MAG: hypothetical protein M3Q11_04115, partial [Pseudomonadota bacterium]|nr:hypothetical protein [Pseudomonadota bacterium]
MSARAALSILLLAAFAGSVGCASTSRVLLSQPRPAVAPQQVRVYYAPPPGRYVEIALLETSSGGLTYGQQNKMDSVIGKLRAEAAKLGANGVLLTGTEHGHGGGGNVGVGIGGGRFGGRSHVSGGVGVDVTPRPLHARGVAIHVTDPPPPESAA